MAARVNEPLCEGVSAVANNAHPTPIPPKSKPSVVSDNQRKKTPQMLAKLRALSLAETFPLTPHEATRRWCKKPPTPYGPEIFYFGPLDDWLH